MKTLLFCNLVPTKWGAYECLLEALAREFQHGGDDLLVAFGGEPVDHVSTRFSACGLRWTVVPGWTSAAGIEQPWRYCRPALRLLREQRPDVAVVNYGNELPALAVVMAARLTGAGSVRWVWVQHQQMRHPSGLTRHLSRVRALTLGFTRLVALYGRGLESLRLRGVPASRLTLIENAIADHPRTRAPGWLHAELGLDPRALLVITTGSLIARKQVDLALRVFAESTASSARAADAPTVVWVVVGDGPERKALEALAAALGVQARVRLLGVRQDVRDIMAEGAVLLHTARAEASAYAILESMAAGIPAVVTDSGAAREQVEDGVSGYVVAADDAPMLVRRLSGLLGDAALRQHAGAAARTRWTQRYRLEGAARAYHGLYRSLALRKASVHVGA